VIYEASKTGMHKKKLKRMGVVDEWGLSVTLK
jgi:hypothetical protein